MLCDYAKWKLVSEIQQILENMAFGPVELVYFLPLLGFWVHVSDFSLLIVYEKTHGVQ